MFGMSSKEFWEDEPQLYWSYRTFYYKKTEIEGEKLDYESWLKGYYFYIAVSVALNNAFSKKKAEYPKEPISSKTNVAKTELQEKMEQEKDKDVRQQIEYNYWA